MRRPRIRAAAGRATATAAAIVAVSAAALAAWAPAAGAQALSLKRTFPSATAGICPRFVTPPPATAAQVQEARRLFALGQEASIVGDHKAARDLFRQAEALNRSDERVAYYLARSSEELKLGAEAVAQYCRYLALAPTGSDAVDVRSRLERLTESSTGGGGATTARRRSTAAARFQAGVEAVDGGRLAEAERAFGDVVTQLPEAAEAYYDRGLVRARREDWGGAERDLERYLQLRRDAEDAAAVRERIAVLRRAASNPTTALAGGAVLPGFGQFYTRRPVFGTIVAAAAAGGLFYALRETERTKDTTYTDLFGNPYPGQITRTDRYNLGTGLAVAGGAALVGAVEAYLYAKGRRAEASRVLAWGGEGEGGTTGASRFGAWVAPVRAPAHGGGGSRLALGVGGRLTF